MPIFLRLKSKSLPDWGAPQSRRRAVWRQARALRPPPPWGPRAAKWKKALGRAAPETPADGAPTRVRLQRAAPSAVGLLGAVPG